MVEEKNSVSFGVVERLYDDFTEMLDQLEERDEEQSDILTEKQKSIYLEFFTVTWAVIEKHSAEILRLSIIDEDRRDDNKTKDFLREDMSQRYRRELLLRCGLVDGGLNDKLLTTKEYRHKLVHDPDNRHVLPSIEEARAAANDALEASEKLNQIKVTLLLHGEDKLE